MPTELLRLIARPIGVAGLAILMAAGPTLVPEVLPSRRPKVRRVRPAMNRPTS